jgi:urea transport system permease protein
MKRPVCLLLIVGLALASLPARGEPAEDALSALASPSFETIRQGVGLLALSGHPRAAVILSALQATRLYIRPDHTLLIKSDDGSFISAAAASPAPDITASSLKPVRMNNAVRAEVEAALGRLRLFAPEAATRLAAAEAVFHSHDPAALAALNRELQREADPAVRRRVEQARAAAILFAAEAADSDRLDAVGVLRERGDIDSRNLLASLSAPKPPVAEAALAAVSAIDRNLRLWSFLQSSYYGLSLGSVLLLAAAGLAITFGVMGVINRSARARCRGSPAAP